MRHNLLGPRFGSSGACKYRARSTMHGGQSRQIQEKAQSPVLCLYLGGHQAGTQCCSVPPSIRKINSQGAAVLYARRAGNRGTFKRTSRLLRFWVKIPNTSSQIATTLSRARARGSSASPITRCPRRHGHSKSIQCCPRWNTFRPRLKLRLYFLPVPGHNPGSRDQQRDACQADQYLNDDTVGDLDQDDMSGK